MGELASARWLLDELVKSSRAPGQRPDGHAHLWQVPRVRLKHRCGGFGNGGHRRKRVQDLVGEHAHKVGLSGDLNRIQQ